MSSSTAPAANDPIDFASYGSDDPRMGHMLIKVANPDALKLLDQLPNPDAAHRRVCIVGFPDDEGVARNGGRIGAAAGPEAALKYIAKVGTIFNPEFDIDLRQSIQAVTTGMAACRKTQSLEQAHEQLKDHVRQVITHGFVPFVIGGGNNQSYPNATGLLATLPASTRVAVINIDAHLDVRPLTPAGQAHSGSPFRQLLQDSAFQTRHGHFCEFAIQGSQCSAAHIQFLRTFPHASTELVWLSDIAGLAAPDGGRPGESEFARAFRARLDTGAKRRGEEGQDGVVFVSFDLDAVRSADAPGVSCASPLGLSAQMALDICYVAGSHPAVKLFDLSEFNPTIEEYRTGRLVAFMFYYFCLGLARRPAKFST
ncbi:hypothetical protein BCR44DRAFT_64128 [Catenaria anguillulae PL171]|uniref:Arginase family-domain-containing protein n=1 Tax=Catenaria anguillulae PL171 TaxID=765915 RepID=A0A1Y2HQQ2_9FUNG|nr:hypothetical protein BCR44DRAFT_64128 [Catenaria anguillulae PL171]